MDTWLSGLSTVGVGGGSTGAVSSSMRSSSISEDGNGSDSAGSYKILIFRREQSVARSSGVIILKVFFEKGWLNQLPAILIAKPIRRSSLLAG